MTAGRSWRALKAFFSGLRVRLLLLVLLAVLPALGSTLYLGLEQRQAATTAVQEEALRLARLTASNQGALLEGARQLLITLSQLPEMRPGASACQALLAQLLSQNPFYANLGVIDLDGTVTCSALPLGRPVNAADRAYFQRAVATQSFAVGDYQIGRITGKSAINFGYPILDAAGSVEAVVFAALDLDWIGQAAVELQLPQGATLIIVDQRGTILARYPGSEQWVGRVLPDAPIIEAMLVQNEGTAQTLGVDGVERLYAFSPLGDGPESSAYISVGIPTEVAYAEANRNMARSLLVLVLVAPLALAAAWLFGDLFIVRKINALLDATRRLAAGDLSTRVTIKRGTKELSQLARAFNEMAQSLQQHTIERQRAEARLQTYTVQLEQSNRDLQEFANVASHDLQEPLRKIQAFGDRLRARYAERLDDDGQDYLERMQSATRRMQTLINDLLTYSRVTTRAQPFTPVSLTDVVGEVISDLEVRLAETGGRVEIDTLPTIEADYSQMRQLLQNLIGNALKYHRPDCPPVVKVYADSPAAADPHTGGNNSTGERYRIVVEDNGIGFDEKYLERILQPFQRLHGRGQYEGTGMGLAICRKIVERHSGIVQAKSMPGQGATFIVTLPVKQP